eukprot:9348580-Ditylum_brightwellii.AAC.1
MLHTSSLFLLLCTAKPKVVSRQPGCSDNIEEHNEHCKLTLTMVALHAVSLFLLLCTAKPKVFLSQQGSIHTAE